MNESIFILFGAGDYYHVQAIYAQKTLPSRTTFAICVSMAEVGGIPKLLPGGTGFLAISGMCNCCCRFCGGFLYNNRQNSFGIYNCSNNCTRF